MTRQERAFHMRQDGLVEPDDAGKPVLPGPHLREQVLSYLLLNGPVDMAARPQFTERGRRGCPVVPTACAWLLAVWLHKFDTMSATRVFASSPGQRRAVVH